MAAYGHHGRTPAAWTGVTISFVGFLIGGYFMVADQPAGFWAGLGVILLGGVVGLVMKSAGLGARESKPIRVTGESKPVQATSE